MPSDPSQEVTRLLHALGGGCTEAQDELFALVYDRLKAMAHRRLRQELPGRTLQTTALVNETYLRLVAGANQTWENRSHFFGAAAEAMRRILVDQARKQRTVKRGGGRRRVPLDDQLAVEHEDPSPDLLALNEALDGLERYDPRKALVVKLRFFVGLTIPETAEVLGVTSRTVDKDWRVAKAWLRREMLTQDLDLASENGDGD